MLNIDPPPPGFIQFGHDGHENETRKMENDEDNEQHKENTFLRRLGGHKKEKGRKKDKLKTQEISLPFIMTGRRNPCHPGRIAYMELARVCSQLEPLLCPATHAVLQSDEKVAYSPSGDHDGLKPPRGLKLTLTLVYVSAASVRLKGSPDADINDAGVGRVLVGRTRDLVRTPLNPWLRSDTEGSSTAFLHVVDSTMRAQQHLPTCELGPLSCTCQNLSPPVWDCQSRSYCFGFYA